MFYSHVNYSVTKIEAQLTVNADKFYSHVNYSVTKIEIRSFLNQMKFYSHVNYSVTKILGIIGTVLAGFTVT